MMSIGLLGQNLIFLISQPRAGSTMLQRILGCHPSIHTVPEPWLMLHPLYALRSEGYESEYNARPARRAMRGFYQMLPGGEDEYVEGLRRMYSYLYGRALANSGKQYFLDKTPRYYFIIPDLYRIFPKARYIILLRNPLAVLCSIRKTWVKDDWFSWYRFKHDLLRAPKLLLEGRECLGEQGITVHYEQLLGEPDSEVQRICDELGVDYVPEMIEYGRYDLPRWHVGDPWEIYQHTRPVSQNIEKWIQALDESQLWCLANDYLQSLGWITVEQMGYSYKELQQVLEARRPLRIYPEDMFSLHRLLKEPAKRKRKNWIKIFVRRIKLFRLQYIWKAAKAVLRKVT